MIVYATGDEHLYLRTRDVPSEWSLSRFESFLYHEPFEYDIRVHMGDFFDTVPTIKELAVFLKYANSVKKPTYMIDGNHEATKKGSTFLTEVRHMITNKLFNIVDEYCSIPNFADFLPYRQLKEFAKTPDKFEAKNKILFTHVRGEIPPHVQPEIDLSLFDKWNKVFAGDLHDVKLSQRNIFYPGSPLSTSRSRSIPKATHGAFRIDTDTNEHTWYSFDDTFPHLLRIDIKDVGKYDENYHNIVYEAEVASAKEQVSADTASKIERIVKPKESVSSLGLTKSSKFSDFMTAYMIQQKYSENQISRFQTALMGLTNVIVD